MSEFATVKCNVPNGYVIHTSEEAPRDGANGERRFVPKETFELRPGVNKVDKKFFKAWLDANSDNDMLNNHLIEYDKGEFENEQR